MYSLLSGDCCSEATPEAGDSDSELLTWSSLKFTCLLPEALSVDDSETGAVKLVADSPFDFLVAPI